MLQLRKRHISNLPTRNIICTLGGGGVGGCDVSPETHVKEIDNLLKQFNAFSNRE